MSASINVKSRQNRDTKCSLKDERFRISRNRNSDGYLKLKYTLFENLSNVSLSLFGRNKENDLAIHLNRIIVFNIVFYNTYP